MCLWKLNTANRCHGNGNRIEVSNATTQVSSNNWAGKGSHSRAVISTVEVRFFITRQRFIQLTFIFLCPPTCSETNKDFVSRNFAFFDCSVHDSCFKCLKSQWSCNWCIYDNKCVVQNSTCRNTGSIINAENVCFNYLPIWFNEYPFVWILKLPIISNPSNVLA